MSGRQARVNYLAPVVRVANWAQEPGGRSPGGKWHAAEELYPSGEYIPWSGCSASVGGSIRFSGGPIDETRSESAVAVRVASSSGTMAAIGARRARVLRRRRCRRASVLSEGVRSSACIRQTNTVVLQCGHRVMSSDSSSRRDKQTNRRGKGMG